MCESRKLTVSTLDRLLCARLHYAPACERVDTHVSVAGQADECVGVFVVVVSGA